MSIADIFGANPDVLRKHILARLECGTLKVPRESWREEQGTYGDEQRGKAA